MIVTIFFGTLMYSCLNLYRHLGTVHSPMIKIQYNFTVAFAPFQVGLIFQKVSCSVHRFVWGQDCAQGTTALLSSNSVSNDVEMSSIFSFCIIIATGFQTPSVPFIPRAHNLSESFHQGIKELSIQTDVLVFRPYVKSLKAFTVTTAGFSNFYIFISTVKNLI